MSTRTSRVSVIVVAFATLVAAGCGSSSKAAAPPSTPKLELAKASAGVSGSAAADVPGPIDAEPTTYVLDGTLPDLGGSAAVYRWNARSPGIDDVNHLATALGIHATASITPDGFQATDGKATLSVLTSAGTTEVSYSLGGSASSGGSIGSVGGGSAGSTSAGGSSTGSNGSEAVHPPIAVPVPPVYPSTTLPARLAPVDVPSAADATSAARDLLDQAGLLAGQQWDSSVTDAGGIAISCAVGQECTDTPGEVTAREVTFTLVVGGARVDGVSWSVTIGEHSRIESVSGEWGSVARLGSYPLRSTGSAFSALQHGDANVGGVEPLTGETPVNAQGAPATAVPPAATGLPATSPSTGTESPARPVEIHVTGASLGLARWNAVDDGDDVVDLVPVYVFYTSINGEASSDVEVLALDPGAITLVTPPPVPQPLPAQIVPTPAPAPTSTPSTSSTSGASPVPATATPGGASR